MTMKRNKTPPPRPHQKHSTTKLQRYVPNSKTCLGLKVTLSWIIGIACLGTFHNLY